MLLFVFWYCHKRGREVRLAKERALTEQEVQELDKEYRDTHPGETMTTTAPEGAPMDEVRAGMEEVEEAKRLEEEAAEASNTASGQQPNAAQSDAGKTTV